MPNYMQGNPKPNPNPNPNHIVSTLSTLQLIILTHYFNV